MTPLRELYDLYYYPNPAKEERRRQLLAEIPTDARDEENYGRTSLHIAAEFADCEAITSLLDRGAGVNDRDEEGRRSPAWPRAAAGSPPWRNRLLRRHGCCWIAARTFRVRLAAQRR